jgi:hypothetical protein
MTRIRMVFPWLLALCAACTPTLNWREIQPEGSEVFAMFPCKPERYARKLPLAGEAVEMRMSSCVVDDVTYAVAYASVSEPGRVDAAIGALREAAARNLGGMLNESGNAAVPGMTPNGLAGRVSVAGRGARGEPLQEQAVFFVKGLRVYQASVVGPKVNAEAADTFIAGLRFAS